jgi:hypothetical protein
MCTCQIAWRFRSTYWVLPQLRILSMAIFAAAIALPVHAQGAESILLQFGCSFTTGDPRPLPIYTAGVPVDITLRVCGQSVPYVGTVTLFTDDSTISLPAPYTFTTQDSVSTTYPWGTVWDATHRLGPMVVFHLPGNRSFFFRGSPNLAGGINGFFAQVIEPAAAPVPAVGVMGLLVLTSALCLVTCLFICRRNQS